jgi:outer membrane protein assembly factor BamB
MVFGLAAIVAAGLNGCNSSSQTTTSTKLVDQPATLLDQPSFVQDWNAPLKLDAGETIKDVAVVDDKVYALTSRNMIFVMKRSSGEIIWYGPMGDPRDHAYVKPVIIRLGATANDDKTIFAIGHTLQVFNVHGRPENTIDLIYNITTTPVTAQKLIFVGLNEGRGRMDAIDPAQQYLHTRWSIFTNGSVDGTVGLGPQNTGVFIASEDGMIRACALDRNPLWPLPDSRFPTGSTVFCGPAVDGSGVYVGNVDGSMFCLDAKTGQLAWQFYAGSGIYSTPYLTDDVVYQAVQHNGLAAVPKVEKVTFGKEGSQTTLEQTFVHHAKWWAPRAERVISTDDKNVYALSSTGSILALDKETGAVVFESRSSGLKAVATNMDDPEIFCGTSDGLIFAVRPAAVSGSYGRLVMNTKKTSAPTVLFAATK